MRDETPSTVAPATIKPDQIAEYHFPRFNNGVCYDLMKYISVFFLCFSASEQ